MQFFITITAVLTAVVSLTQAMPKPQASVVAAATRIPCVHGSLNGPCPERSTCCFSTAPGFESGECRTLDEGEVCALGFPQPSVPEIPEVTEPETARIPCANPLTGKHGCPEGLTCCFSTVPGFESGECRILGPDEMCAF